MLRRIASLIALAVGILSASVQAHAQGCILCYEGVSAAGKGVQDALKEGVLVLLIPVSLILIGIALLVWRKATLTANPVIRPAVDENTQVVNSAELSV